MTRKTFKSALDSPVTLEVERETHPAGIYLTIGQATILLGASDAPALCLAILEAAGHQEAQGNETTEAAHHFGMSMLHLRLGIKEQEYITAEAEAQAELEAEALELFNVNQGINLPDWDHADRAVISSWVRVARRARELAKEATK